ncbi:hypothetical protein BMF94_5900 [Rhodotorula taiwanensis]|uniref:Proteophosphoglycan ppg4 n=1 Tax=Rhodotorula taiwanensis TaxID=741276 RepID=A0A2S5B2Y0_9BASI|nr:hypothetical protein BMF94_5900 [Rhodotorula taiwanensis]
MVSTAAWELTLAPTLTRIGSTHNWLNSTLVYPSFPFTIFAVIHAVRVACVYRGIARAGGYDRQLGDLQAAIVPLVLILGGSTISSVLLGLVPGWIISPVPVATYGRVSAPLIPLLAAKSGLVSFLLSLPALPRETLFCLVDGFSRIMGMATLGVDVVRAHPNPAVRSSAWAMILTAFISGGGGGMIVPMFRMFGPEWGFTSTPAFVKEGLSIDVWSAAFIGYVYATLIDAHPFFRKPVAYLLGRLPMLHPYVHLPKTYFTSVKPSMLLQPAEAKTFCSLLLALMLFTSRIVIPALSRSSAKASNAAAAQKRRVQDQAQKAVKSASTAVEDKVPTEASGIRQRQKAQ